MNSQKFNNLICQRIVILRKKYNLTQEQLAYQSGISKGGLSEIERNMKEPKISTIAKLCNCLGITLMDFFDFKEINDFTDLL